MRVLAAAKAAPHKNTMRFLGTTRKEQWKTGGRFMLFVALTATVWAAYFTWRPPAPMLGLRHVAQWQEGEKAISLTFDDGPHPLSTPLLLAALKRADVRATFFVVGDGLRLYPELASRIVRAGNELANHSQYHHNLTRISPDDFEHEVGSCFLAIDAVYRQNGIAKTTRLFRPPGGGLNREAMNYLYSRGVTLGWWSNNAGDWTRPPAWKIASSVESRLRGGDVILLHDAGIGTPQALLAIVKNARRQGFVVRPMPQK